VMAVLHGRAGKYGKSEAQRRFNRMLLLLLLVVAFTGLLIGLAIASLGGAYGLVGSVALGFVTAAFYWAVRKKLDPELDRLYKERIKHLRGGQIEAYIAWLLADLPDDWHVFNGIKLERDSDIDHVVVGPG